MVETHQRDRVAEREIWGDAADRADLAFDVVEPDVALGRGIELEDAQRSKSIQEGLPNVARKPVADRDPGTMRLLGRPDRGDKEIAAELAYVLEGRAFPSHDVGPEVARREALGDCDRTAKNQGRADCDNAAHAVVHWQAIVELIGRRQAGEAGKPVDPGNQSAMADLSRLRQTGGPGGEYPQGAIVEGHRAQFANSQGIATLARSCKIDRGVSRCPLPWIRISTVSPPAATALRQTSAHSAEATMRRTPATFKA